MSDEIKISALPAVSAAQLTDIFPVLQGGVNKKETVSQLSALLGTFFPNGIVLVTDPTQTIANGTAYIADGVGIVTFTLPTASVGSYFAIIGVNGWQLNVGTGKAVTIGQPTLTGSVSNYWASNDANDTVIFVTIGSNSWQSISLCGNPVTNGGLTALPIPLTTTINNILYCNTANTVSGLATANSGIVVTSTSGVPSVLASPSDTRGHALLGRAAAGMSFSTAYYPNTGTLTGQVISYDGTGYGNSTSTYADTYTINNLLYSSAANVVTGLATANSSQLVTNSSGVPAMAGTMTNGQLVIGSTGGTPTRGTLTAGNGITITNGAGAITISSGVLFASGSWNIGQIIALFGTPQQMVAAPGAGFGIIVVSAYVNYIYDGSHTITGGGTLNIVYGSNIHGAGTSALNGANFAGSGLISGATTSRANYAIGLSSTVAIATSGFVNQGIFISNDTGVFVQNSSTATANWAIQYLIVPMS